MTMTCAEAERFIDAYLDGEFAPAERSEMEQHLASCDRCRHEARRQSAWKSVVRARLERPAAPYGLHFRVQRALDGQSAGGGLLRRVGWRVGPAFLAA